MSTLAPISPPGRTARSLLKKKGPSHAEAYSITISTTNAADSVLLGRRRGRSIVATIGSKLAALIAILMVVVAGFAGSIASAQPARAELIDFQPLIDGICAGQGSNNYGAFDRTIIAPNTGTGKDANATPYEKYGMSGTVWTVWSGFSTGVEGHINADEYRGKGPSTGIVRMVGNDPDNSANLTQWEAQFSEKERNYPGLFNTKNECAAFNARAFPTGLGNLMLNIGQVTIWLSGYTYQTSAEVSSSIYQDMEEPIEAVVTAMKDKLYFAYLAPMIMIGALWMAYVGLFRKQATVALGGLIWSVGAIVVSVLFMTKPMVLPEKMNEVVGGISQNGMAAITSATHGNEDNNICTVRKHNEDETDARTNIRAIQCNLWHSFVYTPWTIGQFGMSPSKLSALEEGNDNGFKNRVTNNGGQYVFRGNGVDLKVLTKEKVSGDDVSQSGLLLQRVKIGSREAPTSEQNWALYYLDHRSNWDDASEPQKIMKARVQVGVTANQLTNRDYNSDFRGDNGTNRLAMGLLSMVAALGAGAMIIMISVQLIILDLGMIMLTLVAPLFFLAALHPGAGRRIAMGWVETILKMALRRIALSIFLAIMVAVFGVMITASADMEWAIAMILIVALAMAGLTYQKQISEMFSGFSLGGQGLQEQPLPGGGAAKRFMQKQGKNSWAATDGGGRSFGKSVNDLINERNGTNDAVKSVMNTGGAGPAAQRPESNPRNTSDSSPKPDTSGSGDAPQAPMGAPEAPMKGGDTVPEGQKDEGGAGDSPQQSMPSTEEENSSERLEGPSWRKDDADFEPARQSHVARAAEREAAVQAVDARVQAKADEKAAKRQEAKRIKQSLKDHGYKGRAIGLGTVVAATAKGALVGGTTGSARAGARASQATIAAKRAQVEARNASAVKQVRQNKIDHERDLANRNKALEQAKAKEKAEQERRAKQVEAERKRQAQGKPSTAPKAPQPSSAPVTKPKGDGAPKPVSAPTVKPQGGKAPKQGSAPVVKPQGDSAPKLSTAAKQAVEGMQAQQTSRKEAREAREAPPLPQAKAIQPKSQAAPPLPPAQKRPSA